MSRPDRLSPIIREATLRELGDAAKMLELVGDVAARPDAETNAPRSRRVWRSFVAD